MNVKAVFVLLGLAAAAVGFALPRPHAAEAEEPRAQVQMLEIG